MLVPRQNCAWFNTANRLEEGDITAKIKAQSKKEL